MTGDYKLSYSTATWTTWNTNYVVTNSTSTSQTVWADWNNLYEATGTATNSNVITITWQSWSEEAWTRAYARTSAQANRRHYYAAPAAETEEDRAARRARQAQREAERAAVVEAERQERAAARERGRQLLLANLSAEQRAEYETHQRFHIRTPSGRRFCIEHGRAHNVFELDAAGRRIREFCGHVGEHVPDEDNVLAQKLLLENDEETFIRIANVRQLA